jgi:O-antigen ligase
MAKGKKKRKPAVPVKPAPKKKAPRPPLPVAAKARKSRKRPGAEATLDRLVTDWADRLGISNYGVRQWGRFLILAIGLGVLLLYSFSAGGYFVVRRGYGELIILWLLVVGLLFELQARGRFPRAGQIELGLFAGYVAWIFLSIFWSIKPAASLDEFVRGMLYVAGFGLFWLFLERREWLGWLGHLFIIIVAIVCFDGLLGKTFPDVLSHPDPFQSNRLNYPITYWNTMAVMMIMGFVIGLRVLADRVTSLVVRCLYAPALFIFLVVLWFTFSRGGLLFLVVGIAIYLYLSRSRLRTLLQAGLLFLWTGLIVAASYAFFPNMIASVPDATLKVSEGHQLALLLISMMAIAAVSQYVIKQLEGGIHIPERTSRVIGYVIAGTAVALTISAFLGFSFSGGRGGPISYVRQTFSDFNAEEKAASVERPEERLFSLQSERFQEYSVSLTRFQENPLLGTGAGTWSIAWIKHRPWDIQVKDGHSLLFETMAELGIPGTLLLLGFVASFFYFSIRDLRFLGKGRERELYGAFFAASTVFVLHAMIDWDWEMPVIALAFFMFAGGLLRYGQLAREGAADVAVEPVEGAATGMRRFVRWNWLLGAGCILGIVVTLVPLVAATRVQAANTFYQQKDYAAADKTVSSALSLTPWDAEALMIKAAAKQAQGRVDEAEELLLDASRREPENDRVFRNLTRVYLLQYDVAEQKGDEQRKDEYRAKAVDAIHIARVLNPLEPRETGDLETQVRRIGGRF